MMTNLPFPLFVVVVTALVAGLTALAMPGRIDLVAGVAAGTGVAGTFAALAVAVLTRIKSRARGDVALEAQAATSMARAFAGLMMARMLAYLALVMAAVGLKVINPAGVGAGLVVGTLVFQALEVAYLRKLT